MTAIENDFGGNEYCMRCLKDIKFSDFRDKVALNKYRLTNLCQSCQDILEEE